MLSPHSDLALDHPIWTPAPDPPTVELWDAWLFAELDAECALMAWWESELCARADAFAAYSAALEREAQAARALEARLGRARRTA